MGSLTTPQALPKRSRRQWPGRILYGSSAIAIGAVLGLAISFRNLPDVRLLRRYLPSQTTYIYDINGELIASLHDEANRETVPLDRISPKLQQSVLAIEDSGFYNHLGIDPVGIGRALLANFSSGGVVEGGSTLTMQLVKNLFLTPDRNIGRKLTEAVLALRLEQVISKDRILELYLNQVYWGRNLYGVEMASRSYFNKSAADLDWAEASFLAALIAAPEYYTPFDERDRLDPQRLERAKERQRLVLQRLVAIGQISPAAATTAANQTLQFGEITSFRPSQSPYVSDAVIQELAQQFGRSAVVQGGLRVQTTIDLRMQRLAEQIVQENYQRNRQRGLRAEQMALVAIDPRTHFIKAMVGGVDYRTSQYNRVTQARRQPGSAFKPFVFYAALATGKYTPSSSIADTPITYQLGAETYSPQNYDRSFAGNMSLTSALAQSRNIPAVRLGQTVGLDRVIEICRRIGISSPMQPVVSLPLGAIGVTPLELTNAYATLASGGWYAPPTLILQVRDSQGRRLLDNTPRPQPELQSKAVAQLNQMMQAVVTSGTGRSAQLNRPAAGKTGTTSAERDIWFVGYTPELVASVWLGNDDNSKIGGGATGGEIAAPIWRQFMQKALENQPVSPFPKP
ncbi:transglycosylase domain-containing protein [Synechococcus elongatus IITB3]|uniref:transglycosylase domain-containing protein n=1 Tax=Synechococcus elongatus TaxID=32046 RepID=UPI0030D04372